MSPLRDPGNVHDPRMNFIQKFGIAHIIQGACAFDELPESIALMQTALALGAERTRRFAPAHALFRALHRSWTFQCAPEPTPMPAHF